MKKQAFIFLCVAALFGVQLSIAGAADEKPVAANPPENMKQESTPMKQELSALELKKRHRVLRYYEVTEEERCTPEQYPGYHLALSKFKKEFPELMQLIKTSPYRSYAEMVSLPSKSRPFLDDYECKFLEKLLNSSTKDEKAKQEVREDIELLKQSMPLKTKEAENQGR